MSYGALSAHNLSFMIYMIILFKDCRGVFSSRDDSVPQWIFGNFCTIFGCHYLGAGYCYGHLMGQSKHAAKQSTVHRTDPRAKNYEPKMSIMRRLRNPVVKQLYFLY